MNKKKYFYLFLIFLISNSVQADILNFKVYEGEEYLAFAEVMPSPVGGLSALYSTIKYPTMAEKVGVQGKVYLIAFINENGDVDDVKVIKGIGAGCDEAAADAIKAFKFEPGKMGGVPAKVKMTIQVIFEIKK